MRKLLVRSSALTVALLLATLTAAGPALAHERRGVGKFELVVGWGTEPAFAGFMNSVQLIMSEDGQPLTDVAAGEIKVDVTFGQEKKTLDMEPAFVVGRFGTPGDYRAYLLPTRAGSYTFRFSGEHDGVKIDSTFTCGEKTFACMEDPADVQFPAKDPSAAQINERLDREFPRVEQKVAAAKDDATSSANTAKMLGIAGVALGLVALIVSLVRGRAGRPAAARR